MEVSGFLPDTGANAVREALSDDGTELCLSNVTKFLEQGLAGTSLGSGRTSIEGRSKNM